MSIKEKLKQEPKNIKTRILDDGREIKYVPFQSKMDLMDELFDNIEWLELTENSNDKEESISIRLLAMSGDFSRAVYGIASLDKIRNKNQRQYSPEGDKPALLSLAKSNAMSKLGKAFGRDLNTWEATETSRVDSEKKGQQGESKLDEVKRLTKGFTKKDLMEFFTKRPDLVADTESSKYLFELKKKLK